MSSPADLPLFAPLEEEKRDASYLAWWEFHSANLRVWDEFKKLAFQLLERGWTHYSAKAIFEVMRFHRALETVDEQYVLNNNYTAYYARLFMRTYPEHAGFFELRRSAADSRLRCERR